MSGLSQHARSRKHSVTPRQANRSVARSAFARELYAAELREHWAPRQLTRGDRLQVLRRYTSDWR